MVELDDSILDTVTGGVSLESVDSLDVFCDTTNKCNVNAVVPSCGAPT